MKKFKIPQAKKGSIALQCEYLSLHTNMKACTLNPHECVLGHKGTVSDDGMRFIPIEQPSIEATLRNCPKLKCEHEFDQFDYDSGDNAEYGHCKNCGHWIDTTTGEDETERFEKGE